jgi:hypothetical protein
LDTLAERYVEDPYVNEYKARDRKEPVDAARFANRWRMLDSVAVPATLLRRGVNVLSLENHRAPIHVDSLKARRLDADLAGRVRVKYRRS